MSSRRTVTKTALVLSIILLIAWVIIGSNASIAWFRADDEIINSLNFGDLKINLYHKTSGAYEKVGSTTEVFSDEALYEPGYTQLVYLQIENAGTVDFTYDLSVIPDLSTLVIGDSVNGGKIDITDYLLFGLLTADSEEELMEKTADRNLAREIATTKLSNYSKDCGTLASGESDYAVMVIYMPEEVANEANYRGKDAPSVEVGIGAVANQLP